MQKAPRSLIFVIYDICFHYAVFLLLTSHVALSSFPHPPWVNTVSLYHQYLTFQYHSGSILFVKQNRNTIHIYVVK